MRAVIKFRIISKYAQKYSITEMCLFFKVSRSGYYDFVKRINLPDKDMHLASLITECHNNGRYRNTYGCRRVNIWLEREKGVHYNYKTVWRVMRKHGLLATIRRKRFFKPSDVLRTYPNLLNRNFAATQPNEKWATDISYIQTMQGTLYLSVIRDLYDNSIVTYKTSVNQSVKLVLDTVRAAMKKETVTEELQLHSDQGFQYASHSYFTLTQQYGITPSMSRRGNPYDNAMAENFFGILKAECIRPAKPKTLQEAQYLIADYISFYNNERIQTKTKLTPLEKRLQLL